MNSANTGTPKKNIKQTGNKEETLSTELQGIKQRLDSQFDTLVSSVLQRIDAMTHNVETLDKTLLNCIKEESLRKTTKRQAPLDKNSVNCGSD